MPRLIWVLLVKKAWVLGYSLSAHQRLIRLGRCPSWSESSLGAQSFCWVCHVAPHLICSKKFCFTATCQQSCKTQFEPLHEKTCLCHMRWTKAQIRSACPSAQSDQHLCCSLSGFNNTSTCYSQNFKTVASLCTWAGQFESYLVKSPEDRFSHDMAHLGSFKKLTIDLLKWWSSIQFSI